MKIALAEQMREIDRLAQERFAIPGIILMERAALAVFEEIKTRLHPLLGRVVYIFCGKGNNGGDGLALGRILKEHGVAATVILMAERQTYQGLAQQNLFMADQYGVPIVEWKDFNSHALTKADLIVDALLGTGTTGAPTGVIAEIIKTINDCSKPIAAIDIPSGVNVNSGQVNGLAIKANFTVTLGLPKPGLLCYPGADYVGDLVIQTIGFPQQLLDSEEININYLLPQEIKALMPHRSMNAHKGTTGHVLVIGGSQGMTGAVYLASLGALRVGCGLVSAGLRLDLAFLEKPAEVMVVPWSELYHRWENFDSIVFGPGLTKMEDGESLLYELIERIRVPLVIDADGLNLLANNKKILKSISQNVILTPHPGEMARLTGLTVSEIQADRIGVARRFAREWKTIVILKGARTVIADPIGNVYINLTGNPGMATGGMGDALAGMISGLMVQGLAPDKAGVVGTYLHGLAGDLAVLQQGPVGIIAGDLISQIPKAIKKVLDN